MVRLLTKSLCCCREEAAGRTAVREWRHQGCLSKKRVGDAPDAGVAFDGARAHRGISAGRGTDGLMVVSQSHCQCLVIHALHRPIVRHPQYQGDA